MKMTFWALALALITPVVAMAEIRVYDFDDGTLQGFRNVNVNDEDYPTGDTDQTDVAWIVSDKDIDLGENGWKLLQGSSDNGIGEEGNPQRIPNMRLIPEPWDARDCLGANECQTQILKSPTFELAVGPISVDIVGGQAQGGRSFDEELDSPPEFPEDFNFMKSSDGWQGFALYDVAADSYVRWGFPSFNNDGKEKDGRDVWERVTIPEEDLSDLANDGKTYRLDIFDSYLGGWGWIGFDTVQIPEVGFVAEPAGFDCNGDGVTNASDLACVASVGDRDTVLGELNTVAGDLDGNGDVSFADFLILSNNFGNESGTYAEGNINLEGGIDFADFLALSDNFGATAAAQAVPEPSGTLMALFGIGVVMGIRRRR